VIRAVPICFTLNQRTPEISELACSFCRKYWGRRFGTLFARAIRPHPLSRVFLYSVARVLQEALTLIASLGLSPNKTPPNEALRSDAALDRQIRRALTDSSYRALHFVDSHCHEGLVTLHGRVPSYFLKQMAQEIAGRMRGLQWIVNGYRS
jgi:hypothetical protein